MQEKLANFVRELREHRLLPIAEWEKVNDAAHLDGANPESIARDLVDRKLLTLFQIRKVWRGQARDLFLNQYFLLDKLGEGGMGEVYHARHTRMDRDVALKLIRKERLSNENAIKRFRREIRAVASLSHENVVMAYDADQAGEHHFYAMEFVDGTNLASLVQAKGPLPVGEACDYIHQAALGLQHASEQNLIHRDIKPSNLLLGKSGVVKVSDFGLARIEDPDAADSVSHLTNTGFVVGTPDYVAPEQARNPHEADSRSDIYSLGVSFYFLLTGDVPFPGGTATEKMLRAQREPFAKPARELPTKVWDILKKMVAKKPADRYQTAQQVADDLAPFVPSKTQAVAALKTQAGIALPPPLPTTPPKIEIEELPATQDRPIDARFELPSSAENMPPARGRATPYVLIGLIVGLLVFCVGIGGIIGLFLLLKRS